ncbi:MAG: hypothetical protein ACRC0G_07215 [Fusobacteriaceae bacterium]
MGISLEEFHRALESMVSRVGNFVVKVSSMYQNIDIVFDIENIDIDHEMHIVKFYDNNTEDYKTFLPEQLKFIYSIIVDNFIDMKMRES